MRIDTGKWYYYKTLDKEKGQEFGCISLSCPKVVYSYPKVVLLNPEVVFVYHEVASH